MDVFNTYYEKRGDETVLLHCGKMVGLYMAPGNGAGGDATIHCALMPVSGAGVNEVAEFVEEDRARAWLLGKYLSAAALAGHPPAMQGAGETARE